MRRSDLEELLLQGTGDRSTDSFLEVHIFGTFNHQAIESFCLPARSKLAVTTLEGQVEDVLIRALQERLTTEARPWIR
jgi:hypothetical protein